VSGAGHYSNERWTFGMRVIPDAVPRARLRTTITYRVHPRLTTGVEVNPLAEEARGTVSPLVNWLAITETKNRPALIVGTSSDRIGTPYGQSFYATLSKNLKSETRLPIAPYAGIAYSTYEHRWLALAGLNVHFTSNISSTVIFDGVRVHTLVNYSRGRHDFAFVLAYCNKPGFSYSISF